MTRTVTVHYLRMATPLKLNLYRTLPSPLPELFKNQQETVRITKLTRTGSAYFLFIDNLQVICRKIRQIYCTISTGKESER